VSAEVFSRDPDIEVAPMHGETILFNPRTDKFCLLNPTAEFVWTRLQKPTTVSQIALDLCGAYQVSDEGSVSRDVEKVLLEMKALEFVIAK
jgi:coenzyme PQQ synthesis protein D (PqqD)